MPAEYEILPHTFLPVLLMTRHAGGAGIQAREGMDAGFRRYDGTLVPIRYPDCTCTYIFDGGAQVKKGSDD